jgi:hypothetical protein
MFIYTPVFKLIRYVDKFRSHKFYFAVCPGTTQWKLLQTINVQVVGLCRLGLFGLG